MHSDTGASVSRFFLWEPCLLLKRALPGITARLEGAFPGGGLRALDVGCGAGRDSVYLASRGYRVKAVDNRAGHLRTVERFAARNGVAVETAKLDLKKAGAGAAEAFDAWAPHLVVVVRFLHRPLLGVLMRALQPGGCLVYEHFKIGAEAFGSPSKPEDLLNPGELRGLLAGWDLAVYNEEGTLDDGRPMVRVVAFKPV